MPGGGSKPGERRGGRQKGTPNKRTLEVQEKLKLLGVDPIERLAAFVQGEIPCSACKKTGKVTAAQWAVIVGGGAELKGNPSQKRTCPVCAGSKIEAVPAQLQQQSARELIKYIAPQLKAIEVDMEADVRLPHVTIGKDLLG